MGWLLQGWSQSGSRSINYRLVRHNFDHQSLEVETEIHGVNNFVWVRVKLGVRKVLARFVTIVRGEQREFYLIKFDKIPKFCGTCGLYITRMMPSTAIGLGNCAAMHFCWTADLANTWPDICQQIVRALLRRRTNGDDHIIQIGERIIYIFKQHKSSVSKTISLLMCAQLF
jgi:hypothetical protein